MMSLLALISTLPSRGKSWLEVLDLRVSSSIKIIKNMMMMMMMMAMTLIMMILMMMIMMAMILTLMTMILLELTGTCRSG